MPRPKKCRRVCGMPGNQRFGPLGCDAGAPVIMAVEEYETIRLIDLEGLTQAQCSAQMGVSRATVQGIYDGARRKLADCLVNGRAVYIEGGDYQVCGSPGGCHRGCPHRQGQTCVRGGKEEKQ